MCLGRDIATYQFAVDQRYLAGNVEPTIGLCCARERQGLTSGPRPSFYTVPSDAHLEISSMAEITTTTFDSRTLARQKDASPQSGGCPVFVRERAVDPDRLDTRCHSTR